MGMYGFTYNTIHMYSGITYMYILMPGSGGGGCGSGGGGRGGK